MQAPEVIFYSQGIWASVKCWKMCVEHSGDYVEKVAKLCWTYLHQISW